MAEQPRLLEAERATDGPTREPWRGAGGSWATVRRFPAGLDATTRWCDVADCPERASRERGNVALCRSHAAFAWGEEDKELSDG